LSHLKPTTPEAQSVHFGTDISAGVQRFLSPEMPTRHQLDDISDVRPRRWQMRHFAAKWAFQKLATYAKPTLA
jgi:hypothetical protein